MYQLPLFDERGKVYFDGVRWVAVIDGGWWMAQGKSEAEAVRKVTAKYYEEMERMTK